MVSDPELIDFYITSLGEVLKRGWAKEIKENREHPPIDLLDRVRFFHEYAFCVFAAFFKFSLVEERWPDLTKAFNGWDYEQICNNKQEVAQETMRVFGNKKKVAAVIRCAEKFSREGWDNFWRSLVNADLPLQLELLDSLPYIGKAARYQLAGAIGIDVAKPDRHLLRFASKYGYPETEEGVQNFTKRIANLVGERVKVVDYVLWRYAEGSQLRAEV
jgi:hypothetical protein